MIPKPCEIMKTNSFFLTDDTDDEIGRSTIAIGLYSVMLLLKPSFIL